MKRLLAPASLAAAAAAILFAACGGGGSGSGSSMRSSSSSNTGRTVATKTINGKAVLVALGQDTVTGSIPLQYMSNLTTMPFPKFKEVRLMELFCR